MRLLCALSVMMALVSASTNCVLNSTTLTCQTSDFVAKYPDPDASNKGIHADVTLSNGEGCVDGVVRMVKYEISVATHFDYSSVPLETAPVGCNSHYEFQTSNTSSPSFFLTSFLPQNADKKEVVSSISVDKIEEGCEIDISMNFVWIDSVSATCSLN
jgi:hypothetical protein